MEQRVMSDWFAVKYIKKNVSLSGDYVLSITKTEAKIVALHWEYDLTWRDKQQLSQKENRLDLLNQRILFSWKMNK